MRKDPNTSTRDRARRKATAAYRADPVAGAAKRAARRRAQRLRENPQPDLPGEEWRPLPFAEWYEASSLGRIRSVYGFRSAGTNRGLHGKILKGGVGTSRRSDRFVILSRCPRKCYLVNRLVCETFHGPPPTPEHEANHIDRDFLNNAAVNLEWLTHNENIAHAKAGGFHKNGH